MRMSTLSLLALAPVAAAAPIELHHQGRLLGADGAPIGAATTITVSLFGAESGGAPLFAQTFPVTPADGYYAVTLSAADGTGTLLDSSLFSGDVWVEVAVGGAATGPRAPIVTVPRAAVAVEVDGGPVRTSGIVVEGAGTVVLGQDTGSACSQAGALVFDPSNTQLKLCNGTVWIGVAGVRTVVNQGGVRRWSDGTSAASCAAYKTPSDALYAYSGDTGDGVYSIQPAGASAAYPVYCDQTTGTGGWTLLMTAAAQTFPFESTHWTTPTTLNDSAPTTALTSSAKYAAFNQVPVQELRFQAAGGRQTAVSLPRRDTLLSFTSATNTTTTLTVTSGSAEPSILVNGIDRSACGTPWRINTFNPSRNAKIRIGGWYSLQWDCSYGADNGGNATGAHLAGFGITDTEWSPYTYGRKSFGIRDAHDHNYSNPGQVESQAHIWGR